MPNTKRKLDEAPVPKGLYIDGGRVDAEDGKHYGGKVIDCDGNVIHQFAPEEENPGADAFKFDKDKGRVVYSPATPAAPPAPKTPPAPPKP